VKYETAAAPGMVLKYIEDKCETADENSIYSSGVGKLSHLTRWTNLKAAIL
jgi:hypothetical protein